MPTLTNITKAYGTQLVLDGFSYTFGDTGFYVLLGESGSGKTTLLNIMAGLVPFQSGTVDLGGTAPGDIDYITQDSFFVDFLTVTENLGLVCDDAERIAQTLQAVGLSDKAGLLPGVLSGGQKQRLAMARSLLKGKKILLLDEPSAALDDKNKHELFQLLRSISNRVLVICSTHDKAAIAYADETVTISKLRGKKALPADGVEIYAGSMLGEQTKKKGIFKALRRKSKVGRRNRTPKILFTAFFALSLCIMFFADTATHKFEATAAYMYKINTLTVRTNDGTSLDDYAFDLGTVKAVVFDYSNSVPDGTEGMGTGTSTVPDVEHEIALNVLPFEAKVFPLADKIKYGTYFTERDQIIVSYEMAEALYGDEPEAMIGCTIPKHIYGRGEVDLEVVGVLDRLDNEIERIYLQAIGTVINATGTYDPENYERLFFVNSRLTDEIENDPGAFQGSNRHRSYTLYFDAYGDMQKFCDKYSEVYADNGNLVLTPGRPGNVSEDRLELQSNVAIPFAVLIAFFTILFYTVLKKTDYLHNNRFIAVFEYAGYQKKAVINRYILHSILDLIRQMAISVLIAVGITTVVNIVNGGLFLVNYQIFTYHVGMLALFLGAMLLISALFAYVMLRRVRTASWYENLIAERDLM